MIDLCAPFRCRKLYVNAVSRPQLRVPHQSKPAACICRPAVRVPLFVIPRPLGFRIGPRPKFVIACAIANPVHVVTRPKSFMKQLSPLHASRSYRPSGLHDPKAAHHSWSFADLPSDSHRLCFRFRGLIHDLPDFRLTTACSLRHKLIVQDFQHAPSLNPVHVGC